MGFARGPKITTDGLVLYLDAANKKSYPGTGTVWTDLSNNNNSGTLSNIVFSNNNYGVFSGSNPRVDFSDSDDININNDWSDRTITVMFKTGSDITSTQVIYKEGGATNGYLMYISGGNFTVGGYCKTYDWDVPTYHSISIDTNTWYMGSLILRGATQTTLSTNVFEGYLNGFKYAMGDGSKMASHTGNISLMYNGISGTLIDNTPTTSNYHFLGEVAILMIHNSSLTEPQQSHTYNATKSRFGL